MNQHGEWTHQTLSHHHNLYLGALPLLLVGGVILDFLAAYLFQVVGDIPLSVQLEQ